MTARDTTDVEGLIQGLRDTAKWIRAQSSLATNYNYLIQAADMLSTLSEDGWRDIASAPYDEPVIVRVGGMTFGAVLRPDASMSSESASCDQWQATIEGEHPPCWSGGACWSSNEDEVASLQPDAWRPSAPEQVRP